MKALLGLIDKWTRDRVAQVGGALSHSAHLYTQDDLANRPVVEPHCLLILDNVSEPELLSSGGMAQLVREK